MKKFVNAIIRIPLEIVNGEINQSYSECATFSFEWIDKIPQKQNFSQAEIIKQLYSFLKNREYKSSDPIQESNKVDLVVDTHKEEESNHNENESIHKEENIEMDDVSMYEDKEEEEESNDTASTISYIEESDDDSVYISPIRQNEKMVIEDVTETPVKMDSLMDIMNIFIKREDLTTRKKPKNSSFKKRSKRKSHRAYTAKNYDETEDLHDGNGR